MFTKSPRRALLAMMGLAFALAFLAWSGLRAYSAMKDHERNDAVRAAAAPAQSG